MDGDFPNLVMMLAAGLWILTRELLLLSAILVAISGLDELFIDGVYLFVRTRRRLLRRRFGPKWTADTMSARTPQGRFAIFVPAWEEAEVIAPMLHRLTATLDHPHYDIFVGIYPNDPATRIAAASVDDPRIRLCLTTRAGPTTKADCLNHLWRAMLHREGETGARYKAVVLHDAEDVVHACELRIFDHLIPKRAMVQLPVVPFTDDQSPWVSGHYADEFAEQHGKNMTVREALGAALPSAGVACAFAREPLGRVAAARGGLPFDSAALTEDYELGLTISRMGGGAFVRLPQGAERGAVATREHFPATFGAALRQKTRWLVGIAFQGWDRLGWQGGLAERYMLLRDRKPLANAIIIVLAYAAMALAALCYGLHHVVPSLRSLPPLVEPDSPLAALLLVTSGLLLWRLVVRAAFTTAQHGWVEGALSIPRSVIANIFGVAAARRAVGIWLALLFRGQALRWEKTAHRFPEDGNP
ncbi:glycosyl transferase family protein [Pacificimonas flava]|uniref:Bacteriophage N4 adsorption protein B n=1 Tax=Pacificimonas flava TaxID=1234595 RepID=M2TB42_9SPHN|nr:glycosyl transferase family protein [Pacificimonas flava]EMD83819.1 bacteriophage N4 adsorption protein B [Pacificimonas flava]MBB5280499.1 adsorption protein B [Pacificimonas flava]